jgi:hypothetical protein
MKEGEGEIETQNTEGDNGGSESSGDIAELKTVNLSVTISRELEEQFLILAASLGMGKSEAVAYCIRIALSSHSPHIHYWLIRKEKGNPLISGIRDLFNSKKKRSE